ncbi:MAG TPA: hypothetical protein VFO19_18580 [Vicinamibacterales bacterium]|nr:hypothetical protein [Vicinamibacterales bacterium]
MRRFTLSSAFICILILTVAPACTSFGRGPVQTGPGTLASGRQYLEGRWALISYEVFPPGQPPIQLKGEGSLLYDAFGNLEIEIRVPADTAQALEKAGIQTSDGMLSTKGRTVIDQQNKTLTYVIQGQPPQGAPSGAIALNRPRHYEVNGNELTLTTKDDNGKPTSIGRWRKAQ